MSANTEEQNSQGNSPYSSSSPGGVALSMSSSDERLKALSVAYASKLHEKQSEIFSPRLRLTLRSPKPEEAINEGVAISSTSSLTPVEESDSPSPVYSEPDARRLSQLLHLDQRNMDRQFDSEVVTSPGRSTGTGVRLVDWQIRGRFLYFKLKQEAADTEGEWRVSIELRSGMRNEIKAQLLANTRWYTTFKDLTMEVESSLKVDRDIGMHIYGVKCPAFKELIFLVKALDTTAGSDIEEMSGTELTDEWKPVIADFWRRRIKQVKYAGISRLVDGLMLSNLPKAPTTLQWADFVDEGPPVLLEDDFRIEESEGDGDSDEPSWP